MQGNGLLLRSKLVVLNFVDREKVLAGVRFIELLERLLLLLKCLRLIERDKPRSSSCRFLTDSGSGTYLLFIV